MGLVQIIRENDQPKYAVIDWDLFMKFRDQLEDLEDYIELQSILNESITETIPLDVYEFIKNPIKAYRIDNGLTQEALAKIMKVSQPYIAKLESQKKPSEKFIIKMKKAVSKYRGK